LKTDYEEIMKLIEKYTTSDGLELPCAIGWVDCNQPIQNLRYKANLEL